MIAEGEEEVGSDNLEQFVEEQKDLLAAEAVVISDSAMFAPGLPSILSSLRGLAYFEIDVHGPAVDLHSGATAARWSTRRLALARILATMHDENGHIAIAGFYDSVRELAEPAIREQMPSCRSSEKTFPKETGAPELGGERGYTVLEQLWTRRRAR